MKQFSKGGGFPGNSNKFRKATVVSLVKMTEEFECESREGVLIGQPGDFLAEDGHGGFYPISAEFHAANYVELDACSEVAQELINERVRQIDEEGFTADLDDLYEAGEMASAAAGYATFAGGDGVAPWPVRFSKVKSTTPRRDLVKAGALIIAEIERLDRLSAQSEHEANRD